MNEKDKFMFDLKGFLLLPEVLNKSEVSRLVEHEEQFRKAPETLPPEHRSAIGGPGNMLIGHPAVLDVLHDVIGKTDKIRLEGAFYTHREAIWKKWSPHAGPGGYAVNPNYNYFYRDGQMFSGMTRVVWELTEVKYDQGGTYLMPGSHKSNLVAHPEVDRKDSGAWETYSCPPGSVLIFSEAVRHSSADWTNTDNPRRAVFTCYNHICVRHHRPDQFPREVIEALPPEKQRFFHDVYHPQFDREMAVAAS